MPAAPCENPVSGCVASTAVDQPTPAGILRAVETSRLAQATAAEKTPAREPVQWCRLSSAAMHPGSAADDVEPPVAMNDLDKVLDQSFGIRQADSDRAIAPRCESVIDRSRPGRRKHL